MVSINYSAREVCCKIVYYGPGLSGKTTNLQYVHSKVPGNTRGDLISLATEADRTLYFDFLPINIGTINGFAAKFQLYTVPGQVYYNATRKLVLRGVDGVVFVADSQPDKMDENIESLINLEENLREYGYDINTMPLVIQYNKRDLPGVMPVPDLDARLNPNGRPTYEASATVGNGVFDTLKLIIKLVLEKAKSGGTASSPRPTLETNQAAREPQPIPAQAEETPAQAVASQSTLPPAVQEMQSSTTEEQKQPSLDEPILDSPASATGPPMPQAEAPQMSPSQPAPAADPTDFRPYPGDRRKHPESTTSVSTETSEPTAALGTPPKPQAELPSNLADDESSRPAMAPPLKRRKTEKKRGFFKRLFGIK